jgi:hypothetical protein
MKYNNLNQFCDTENWVFFPQKRRKKLVKFTLKKKTPKIKCQS